MIINLKFTKSKLEQVPLDLPKEEKYPHRIGEKFFREQSKFLIKEDLSLYLSKKYSKEKITQSEIVSVFMKLKPLPASNLYISQFKFNSQISSSSPFGRGRVRDHKKWNLSSLEYLPTEAGSNNIMLTTGVTHE